MALSCAWRCWIMLAWLAGTMSLGCERLRIHNTKTLGKLIEMGGRLPRHCVTRRVALQTQPLDLITLSNNLNAEDKIRVIHQTLDQINKTFTQNLSTAPWDAALLEGFRILLIQQLEDLRGCVREPLSYSNSEEIQEYFGKLREFLELERFGECAWKIVCSQTKARLQQIQTIIAKISKSN
uniref:interferon alpha-13-like n=1 Tax=Pristiophorus japonicus TaxID=55135 RepID=UPI00398E8109